MKPNYRCQFLLTNSRRISALAITIFLSTSVFSQQTLSKQEVRQPSPAQQESAYLVSNTSSINSISTPVKSESKLKFSLKAEVATAKLSWISSAESNTSHFIIEKSMDGKNFAQAAMIFTGENLKGPQQYRFSDPLDFEAVHYLFYRIRVVDMNGNISYSDTRVMKVDHDNHNISYMVRPTDIPTINE
jgi:hypothetical protein